MAFKAIILLLAGIAGVTAAKCGSADQRLYPLRWLLFVLPFCAGGFDHLSCAATSAYLLVYLVWLVKQEKRFVIRLSDALIGILVLTVCYGIGCFWAADRGMASWGIVRFLPVLLFALALLQFDRQAASAVCGTVPLSGALMTVLSFVLQFLPGLAELVMIDGRLAGFFEYPNAYAAFLIAGLVISATEMKRSHLIDGILVFGVFQSGSRTGFLVMLVVLAVLVLVKREKRYGFVTMSIVIGCMVLSVLPGLLGMETSADRYLTISGESSTLLGRFLYFADAGKLIARNPLGLGYLGYHAVQGSIQTGVYDVTHVHNWLLQILLDVGWIPAVLLVWVFLRSFFSKGTHWRNRLILLAILGHGMMDFDLEFLALWLVVLTALDYGGEKPIVLRKTKLLALLGTVAVAVCIWLGTGDLLYRMGQVDLCLKITPFHTHALEYHLTELSDTEELDRTAEQVLALKPTSSVAYSAKANVAFAKGRIDEMIPAKRNAIACARYSMAEYCDYFEKLYQARAWYLDNGDEESAKVCLSCLKEIPELLAALEAETAPLAWKLSDKPELTLPEPYRSLLAQIAS